MASLTSQILNIKPFDGNGFDNWEFRLKLLLDQHDVLIAVTNNMPSETDDNKALEDYKRKDIRARNIIVNNLSDNILEMIKDKTSAKEMLSTLESVFRKTGISSQVQYQRKLRNLKYDEKKSLNSFLIEFEKTVSELRNAGGRIDTRELITQLLSVMPPSYAAVT